MSKTMKVAVTQLALTSFVPFRFSAGLRNKPGPQWGTGGHRESSWNRCFYILYEGWCFYVSRAINAQSKGVSRDVNAFNTNAILRGTMGSQGGVCENRST